MGVKIDVLNREIEMGIGTFVAYSYFATTESGKYIIRGAGKFAANYAAQQLRKTGYTFLQYPVKHVVRGTKVRTALSILKKPQLAGLVVGAIAFHAVGQTTAVQKTAHIGYNHGSVLGMGGTL